jgi:cobalt-zinc-cadmium efflux system membrane fusion protein
MSPLPHPRPPPPRTHEAALRLPKLAALAGLVVAAAIAAAAPADLIRITAEQAKNSGVATAPLAEMRAEGGLRLPGQVVVPPAQIEVIAAPLPAMVAAVKAATGETIRKGQLLARLQGASLAELQRDFAAAQSQAQLAADNLQRDESLYAEGIIAQARLAATRAAQRQAELLLAEKRQALRLAGVAEPGQGSAVLSGSADIRAPFDGVLLDAPVAPGQRVDSMTPLFKLGRLSPLWIELQVSPEQAAAIAPGDAVTVPGCARPARVTLVMPQMQAASQSHWVRAELAQPEGCVAPFQYVRVVVAPTRAPRSGTWSVPTAALVRHQGAAWLFVAAAGGFRPVAAQVLDETPEAVRLGGELPGDAQIAVRGVSTLKAIWLGLGDAQGK